jgi:hypothetical protein
LPADSVAIPVLVAALLDVLGTPTSEKGPMLVVPSMTNVTDPAGCPPPVVPDTVAVKVIESPYVDGLSEETTAVDADCKPTVMTVWYVVKPLSLSKMRE